MKDWMLRWLGLDVWQRKIESDVGLCRIQVQDSFLRLQNENQYLRNEVTRLLDMLEKKVNSPTEGPRKLTIRQEIAERTRLAFEEDELRSKGAIK